MSKEESADEVGTRPPFLPVELYSYSRGDTLTMYALFLYSNMVTGQPGYLYVTTMGLMLSV